MPLLKAWTKTISSGSTRKMPRNSATAAMRTNRTSGRSWVTSRCLDMAEPPAGPDLEQIVDQEQHEGDEQHGGGDRGCPRIVEFLEPDDDQQRRDLADIGDVAGDEDHRSVFADRAGKRQGKAGEPSRKDCRQQHLEHRLPAPGAKRGGRF